MTQLWKEAEILWQWQFHVILYWMSDGKKQICFVNTVLNVYLNLEYPARNSIHVEDLSPIYIYFLIWSLLHLQKSLNIKRAFILLYMTQIWLILLLSKSSKCSRQKAQRHAYMHIITIFNRHFINYVLRPIRTSFF